MAPGYRDVYRYYLMLMKGLAIQDDLFRLSMKDLAQLYEYWCFLKIHELLSRKHELIRQDVVKLNRGGLFVTLDRTRASRIEYRNPKNGEIFTLYYNSLPSGDGSETVSQRPDNVLTLKKQDASIEYKYVFDAKYRINPAYEGTPYRQSYKTPGPQEDDINTMHRYRDAIVYATSRDQGQREVEHTMFGAYVLFPYSNEEEYREHRFYRSIALVNVGALPFLPSATSLVEQFLDELILDSPEKAYERSTRPRGTQSYYEDKLSGKTVLVGTLSRPEQLNDLLAYGFYHVPLRHFVRHGDLANLAYVAIYQSNTLFGREQAGIHYYGRIKSWSVMPRDQIQEIPLRRGAPTELYAKLVVEEWLPKRMPIVPGGHGVKSVLLTSEYMFKRAREVAELRLETEDQLRDWREKRRRGKVSVRWDRYEVDRATQLERLDVEEEGE
ncbi:nuclease domain-containing protein [Cohnella nanjingensis]|uniref:nuclease domain-containing protein n=1 Tax=Cohnella nanjingensis TaxID=1387779 RepID=UPI0028B0AF0C|nr:nuclease domain-containing protein [Cohnella nanjingensis]